jgi:hypothetical protein
MDDHQNDDVWMPYPELVATSRDTYEIIDSRGLPGMPTIGMTDKVQRILWVPFSEPGRVVSQHELAHVMFSPEFVELKKLRTPLMAVRAVEDARVNLGLRYMGVPLEYDESTCAEVLRVAEHELEAGHVASLTLLSVASFGTNLDARILELIAQHPSPSLPVVSELAAQARARLERARQRRGEVVATFWQGVRITRWLVRQLLERGYVVPQGRDGTLVACCGGIGTAEGRCDQDVWFPRGRLADGVLPGRLRIVTPPLLHRRESPAGGERRRRVAADVGTEVRYFDRFVYDRRVFACRVPTEFSHGGTVLIDASGSMGLRAADLERIILGIPEASVVAIYAGSGDTGELRIVVRNGYRAAARDLGLRRGGNVVDLPALRWLARQPPPRLWISDGEVTGCGDVPTAAIKSRCRQICKEAQIEQVRDPARAAEVLARARSRTS